VSNPPIHDVLRLAHVLGISSEGIQAVVFEERKTSGPRRQCGAVPLLENGCKLFG
jgi:hypothetical protein